MVLSVNFQFLKRERGPSLVCLPGDTATSGKKSEVTVMSLHPWVEQSCFGDQSGFAWQNLKWQDLGLHELSRPCIKLWRCLPQNDSTLMTFLRLSNYLELLLGKWVLYTVWKCHEIVLISCSNLSLRKTHEPTRICGIASNFLILNSSMGRNSSTRMNVPVSSSWQYRPIFMAYSVGAITPTPSTKEYTAHYLY